MSMEQKIKGNQKRWWFSILS